MCIILSLVCSRLDFCTKDVITKKVDINHIVNTWKYRYGKKFHSCVIWIELDTYSTTLENYLNGFRLKEEDYKIVKPKSKITYGKFLGNVGVGKVSSPPKSGIN